MKAVGLVILVAMATTGLLGQEAPRFKAGVDLVALNVVVVNRQQQFVSGLTANNFAVYEDGVQQDLSFFAAAELPLDLAIVLDTSASMAERMSTARQAAVNFVSALRPSDRLLAIDVKETARILAPLSHDIDAAKQAILKTTASGGTAIYNAMYLTLREMMRDRRRLSACTSRVRISATTRRTSRRSRRRRSISNRCAARFTRAIAARGRRIRACDTSRSRSTTPTGQRCKCRSQRSSACRR